MRLWKTSPCRLACAAALFAATALPSREALAQRDPLESRYDQGVALREQHRDADAVALYRALYDETHAPRALAQMALAEAALGQWTDAEEHLTTALAATGDGWTQRHRAALEGAQRTIREHLGSLDVVCSTPGAELWIQGRRVSALPLARPARVVAGTVAFEVRAQGHVTVMRVATVAPSGFARETVDLVAATPAVTPSPTPALTTAAAPPPRPPPAAVAPPRTGSLQRTLGIAAAAGAGVFLIGGAVAYVVGLGQANEFNDTCPPPDSPGLSSECSNLVSSAHTMEALAVTGFVGGGLLAAGATVLLLTSPSRQSDRGASALACGRGPGDVGVTCRLTF